MADPVFYDALHSEQTAGASFSIAERPLPPGWLQSEQDDWITIRSGEPLRGQGWKIHASATPDSAEHVLTVIWEHCLAQGVQFKFLRSPMALLARVSKYAPRGYSGKLVTIYPSDDAECERLLNELGRLLDGVPGPYILSDLRWGTGPLHVRYGAFTNRYTVDERGAVVPALDGPDGEPVPDRRDPVFSVPDWVELPDFLAPHLEARNAITVEEVPYDIERALHFSNGGGIYLARDKHSGETVVLKEGRPHAGLDAWGHDAARRVTHEFEVLVRLRGIEGIPAALDLFELGEHRFLAMEHIEGAVLNQAVVGRYPLIDPTATCADYAEYTAWALDVHSQVERILAAVHARGVAFCDLHLFNIIERSDGRVCLLDFEVACEADATQRAGLGNQGFAAPSTMTGADADRYSLACLKLALFLPMTNLLGLHRVKARHFVEIITDHFPIPAGYFDDALALIAPGEIGAEPALRTEPDPEHWPELREDIARAILASATPERDDRLFPGDVQQFAVGGLGLAYGAAGVLYALAATGAERDERFERWLIDHATRPAPGTRMGLYDGLHGAAYALDFLGHRQAALDVLDVFLAEDWESLGGDLAGGLAGAGLNLLHLARSSKDSIEEVELNAAGLRCAEILAERVSADPAGRAPSAGLMHGGTGRALLLMRAFDETGDKSFLDVAETVLERDLSRCVVRENGSMEVDEGWRTVPYLETGSIGVGVGLDAFLQRRGRPEFADASLRIAMAATSSMYILPGLFSGRAGVLAYLAARSADPLQDPLVRRQVRALSWHALPYADGMAFPGTGLLRLSMDLATGSAGVLLALGSALGTEPVGLPLVPLAP